MVNADSVPSAGAGDDSQQKAEVTSESQHSIKPNVVGLPSSTDEYDAAQEFFKSGKLYYKSSPNHSLNGEKPLTHVIS